MRSRDYKHLPLFSPVFPTEEVHAINSRMLAV